MPEDGGKEAVRVTGIDDQRGNLLAVAQTKVRPGFAGVGGLVNSVAHGEIRPLQTLAARHVDDVRIGRSDRDGANRLRRLIVKDRIPRAAVVSRLPNAAIHLPHVEDVRLARDAGGSAGSPPRNGPIMRQRISW